MNRPIKFRAWDGKKMIEPNMSDSFGQLNNAIYNCIEKDQILMQFTGLLDKNGKEIYKGDVVISINKKGYESGFKVIEWRSNGMGTGFNLSSKNTFEVIGNIYQNPELLK